MRPFSSHISAGRTTLLMSYCAIVLAIVSSFRTFPLAFRNRVNHDAYDDCGVGRNIFSRIPMGGCGSGDGKQDYFGINVHHSAVKTRNMTLAIQFYSLLGFKPTAKFKAGPARAAWLEQKQSSSTNSTTPSSVSRIELIEVPSWILKEPEGMKRRAFDLFENQEYLGHNHLALDVTSSIDLYETEILSSERNYTFLLSGWIEILNQKSLQLFRKTLRVALGVEQFMVGSAVYERAFIYDADGALIELLCKTAELDQRIDPMSGWERYDWFEEIRKNDTKNNTI